MSEPSILFNVDNEPFGDLTADGWNHGNVSYPVSRDTKTSVNALGNETAYKQHNVRTDYSQSFTAASATVAPTVVPSIGKLVGSAMLTSIVIDTGLKFAEMNLTGHQHAVNPHADTLMQALHGITLSAPFGAIDFMTATAGDNATLISSRVEIVCDHIDVEKGTDGNHLVGNNGTAKILYTQVWQGVPTTPCGDATIRLTSDPKEETVNGFITHTYNGEKPLALA